MPEIDYEYLYTIQSISIIFKYYCRNIAKIYVKLKNFDKITIMFKIRLQLDIKNVKMRKKEFYMYTSNYFLFFFSLQNYIV